MTDISWVSKGAWLFVKFSADAVLIYVAYCSAASPVDQIVLHLRKTSSMHRSTSLLLQTNPCAIFGQLDPK
jgi:hypothetical protein